jgi:hypothetical protein
MHKHPRSSTARLAVVEEDTKARPRDGLVNVGVVEDDVGRLSAQLESDVLEVGRGSRLHDLSADEGRTGEGDLHDLHVRGDRVSDGESVPVDNVEDSLGETGLEREGSDTERGHLGRLRARTQEQGRAGSDGQRQIYKSESAGHLTLRTIQFPVASAGPSFQASMRMGTAEKDKYTLFSNTDCQRACRYKIYAQFQGIICPTTPIGSRRGLPPSERRCMTSDTDRTPWRWRTPCAKESLKDVRVYKQMCLRCYIKALSSATHFPLSSDSSAASSSACSSIRAASLCKMTPRA